MQPIYAKRRVYENIEISKNIYRLSVECRFDIKPGQFFMLRCWEDVPALSRPISVHYKDENIVSFLYEVKGKGTKLLSALKPDDHIEMLGPLGNGFDVEKIKGNIAVVTGGIGIAPMLYAAKSIKNSKIDLYAGFRDDVYCIDEFKEYADKIYVATDSGKSGHKGFITDILEPSKYSLVLCLGPEAMMKKVVEMCKEKDVKVYISMERHMGCGIGACLTCTCKTSAGNRRTCKDGPVFDGREVIFDDEC